MSDVRTRAGAVDGKMRRCKEGKKWIRGMD
jgi:hypothetical protein